MALEKNQSSTMEYNNITNSENAALLPHLESFEKMLKLPVVEAAWHQSQDVYGRVKGKLHSNIIVKIFVSSIAYPIKHEKYRNISCEKRNRHNHL